MQYFKFLRESGGSEDMHVNGSITPKLFLADLEDGQVRIEIYRIMICVSDFGTFDSGSFGNGVVLANGIEIGMFDTDTGNLVHDFLDGKPVIINTDWNRFFKDADVSTYGSGNETLTGRWTFTKSGGPTIVEEGLSFGMRINDDLTALEGFTVHCQGVVIE